MVALEGAYAATAISLVSGRAAGALEEVALMEGAYAVSLVRGKAAEALEEAPLVAG